MARYRHLTDDEVKSLERDNGYRLFDFAEDVIAAFLEPDRPFALRPSLLLDLQKIAVDGIESDAGHWRAGTAVITGSNHHPPAPHLIANIAVELCDYVNDNWHEKSAFHLASFIMWRVNWIHPFSDGNGRTSRMLSYIVLCAKLGYLLPGSPAIPQQIEADRGHYIKALEAADAAESETGAFDFSVMEEMLKGMLATQLLSVIEDAEGERSE